jgi:hypothetical protein
MPKWETTTHTPEGVEIPVPAEEAFDLANEAMCRLIDTLKRNHQMETMVALSMSLGAVLAEAVEHGKSLVKTIAIEKATRDLIERAEQERRSTPRRERPCMLCDAPSSEVDEVRHCNACNGEWFDNE